MSSLRLPLTVILHHLVPFVLAELFNKEKSKLLLLELN